ncbi:MAG: Asp-tRNA(Asn)/Glu-tRNA(Gln) amidotransferase subunit GatC [Pseudomonadota bacterium]
MPLDHDTVQRIAHLARLEVSATEIEKYAHELANILELVKTMSEVDTQDVAAMTHPRDPILRFRADEVTAEDRRSAFQEIAPDAQDGLYLVPKVID